MEADQVYSELGGKISQIEDDVEELQSASEGVRSSVTETKTGLDTVRSEIQVINTALKDLKPNGNGAKDPQVQGLFDQVKAIEAANAASEKRALEQQGMLGKMATDVESAAKAIGNWPDTAKGMVTKAWDDGKKEILGVWDESKKEIVNSLTNYTTKSIKESKDEIKKAIKEDIKAEVKSWVFDDVKSIEEDKKNPPPLTDAELEEKIREVLKKISKEE